MSIHFAKLVRGRRLATCGAGLDVDLTTEKQRITCAVCRRWVR
jgi:hypothetical protein